MEKGSKGLGQLVAEFGDDILLEDGNLDRRRFANIVFKDEESVDKLNSITHPLILQLVLERTSGDEFYAVNTPLLFEAGFDKDMDYNVVVKADESQIFDRGIKRDNISKSEIKDRLKYQFSLSKKLEMTDLVIDNSSSMRNTKRQVSDLWKILTKTTQSK